MKEMQEHELKAVLAAVERAGGKVFRYPNSYSIVVADRGESGAATDFCLKFAQELRKYYFLYPFTGLEMNLLLKDHAISRAQDAWRDGSYFNWSLGVLKERTWFKHFRWGYWSGVNKFLDLADMHITAPDQFQGLKYHACLLREYKPVDMTDEEYLENM